MPFRVTLYANLTTQTNLQSLILRFRPHREVVQMPPVSAGAVNHRKQVYAEWSFASTESADGWSQRLFPVLFEQSHPLLEQVPGATPPIPSPLSEDRFLWSRPWNWDYP